MKLKPMKHQKAAHKLMHGREEFALFPEQGTGKTYMILADVERNYEVGFINAFLCIAPRGVHTNWVKREIPKHLSCDYMAIKYEAGLKRFENAYEELLLKQSLRILVMHIDAAVTPRGQKIAMHFLHSNEVYLNVDESQRIKNPRAARTKALMQFSRLAKVRRITTGTAATNSPADVFSQFQFLKPGLLQTNSYRAFVAEYTELLGDDNELVKHISAQTNRHIPAPQMPARDVLGNPIYKNLDRLHKLMKPHSFRVTKAECLDLPEKIYKRFDFDLLPKQRVQYDSMKNDLRLELDTGEITDIKKLAMGTKLQQITSGFILIDSTPVELDSNPRMELFKEIVTDIEGSFIVWAKFIHEIESIRATLTMMKIDNVGYYGKIKQKEREEAIDQFQSGEVKAFVGHAKAGGVGLDLFAAETVIYYSNDFSLEDRLQSEDRAHRIGQTKHVVYIDITATNTIDERVLGALENKTNMAAAIMGEIS